MLEFEPRVQFAKCIVLVIPAKARFLQNKAKYRERGSETQAPAEKKKIGSFWNEAREPGRTSGPRAKPDCPEQQRASTRAFAPSIVALS